MKSCCKAWICWMSAVERRGNKLKVLRLTFHSSSRWNALLIMDLEQGNVSLFAGRPWDRPGSFDEGTLNTLHPASCTLHSTLYTLHPTSFIPTPCTVDPKSKLPSSEPRCPNPKPQTPKPKPQTPNPKPESSGGARALLHAARPGPLSGQRHPLGKRGRSSSSS